MPGSTSPSLAKGTPRDSQEKTTHPVSTLPEYSVTFVACPMADPDNLLMRSPHFVNWQSLEKSRSDLGYHMTGRRLVLGSSSIDSTRYRSYCRILHGKCPLSHSPSLESCYGSHSSRVLRHSTRCRQLGLPEVTTAAELDILLKMFTGGSGLLELCGSMTL